MGLALIKRVAGGGGGSDPVIPTYVTAADVNPLTDVPESPNPGDSWLSGAGLLFYAEESGLWSNADVAISDAGDLVGVASFYPSVAGSLSGFGVTFGSKRIRVTPEGITSGTDLGGFIDWVGSDPTTGAGLDRPEGSLALASDAGTIPGSGPWIKTGAADTDWFDLSSLA